MFFFHLTYQKPLEEIERLLPEHVEYLERWYAQGRFLCSGRKQPRTGGVILALCGSREEAERIRDEDPFYREGAAEYEIIEFQPTKMSEGFRDIL